MKGMKCKTKIPHVIPDGILLDNELISTNI
jgi:hypothetical protein